MHVDWDNTQNTHGHGHAQSETPVPSTQTAKVHTGNNSTAYKGTLSHALEQLLCITHRSCSYFKQVFLNNTNRYHYDYWNCSEGQGCVRNEQQKEHSKQARLTFLQQKCHNQSRKESIERREQQDEEKRGGRKFWWGFLSKTQSIYCT